MKRILTNNLLLKIAAVVIAVLLWGSVRISEDAVVSKNFNVPVNYINAEYLNLNDLYLKEYPKTVTVSVKARTSAFQNIRTERFNATADLSKRYGDDPFNKSVSLSVSADPAIENTILEMNCKNGIYLDLVLGSMQEKTFEIQVMTVGELPEGMHLNGNGFTVEPSAVTVRGPETLFSKLSMVVARVNLDGFQGDFLKTEVPLCLYDSDNHVIEINENTSLSKEVVQVSMDILKTKSVGVAFEGVSGVPAAGYRYGGLKSDVEEVEVVGLKADLAELTNVLIPKTDLNIDGADGDREFFLNLEEYLPEGITLYDSQKVAKATVFIERLQEKGFRISRDDIRLEGMSDAFEYEIVPSSVLITLEGFNEDLESMSAEELDVYVSVEGLDVGQYENLEVNVNLRDGFRMVNRAKIQIRIRQPEESTRESEEESSVEEETPTESSEESSAEEVSAAETELTNQEDITGGKNNDY